MRLLLIAALASAFTPKTPPAKNAALYAPHPNPNDHRRQLTALEAEAVLSAYDSDHMEATISGRGPGKSSLGGRAANALQAQAAATLPLREAVSILLADCHRYASIRLGITSPDTQLAVDALGTWVDALGLPRGLLYGADDEGQPLDLTGGAYLKYTSRRSRVDEHSAPAAPGSARLHPYSGDFAGVTLAVGAGEQFRQYAALPLGLFCDDVDARAAPLTPLPPPEP